VVLLGLRVIKGDDVQYYSLGFQGAWKLGTYCEEEQQRVD
jgi:hypothetical protein